MEDYSPRFFESSGVFKKRELVFLEMDLKDSISAQEHNHSIDLVRVRKEDIENVDTFMSGSKKRKH